MRKTKPYPIPDEVCEKSETIVPRKAPEHILEAIESINELVRGSKLSHGFYSDASVETDYIANLLGLSPVQAVLLSILVEHSHNIHFSIDEIASIIGCSRTRALMLQTEIDSLIEKSYVSQQPGGFSVYYHVPTDVIDSLRKNQPYVSQRVPVKDTPEFFEELACLMHRLDNGMIPWEEMSCRTLEMLEDIKDTPLGTGLRGAGLLKECELSNLMIFLFMANNYLEEGEESVSYNKLILFFRKSRGSSISRRTLTSGSGPLFEENLLQFADNGGMVDRRHYQLTAKAIEELLGEKPQGKVNTPSNDLINPETLTEKRLFYNADERKQIADLTSLLSQERFSGVQSRLQDSGLRTGFCCIFYGAPGTGKTETVYQIARQTGRCIMRVDVEKIKDKWVGESEKNIKAVFEKYRNLCKNSEVKPILLFNEADGVLSTRLTNLERSVDQMANSIQNIILQEMETIEGIMIATTNLTGNLDKAFERRFIYKTRFEIPSPEARAKIWQAMMPALTDAEAKTLAEKFNLSGGEIENIVRKHTVQSILSGDVSIDLDTMIELCRQERLHTSGRAKGKIGF